MNKNYFSSGYFVKVAWRNLTHNKTSSFINISGLTIGIACVLMIVIYIQNEWSYDKFHRDTKRIFQVALSGNIGGQEFQAGNTPPPVGNALVSNFPEFESYTRFYKARDIVVRYGPDDTNEKFFTEKNILGVDSNFLQFFDFKMLEGDPASALLKPGSVVITADISKKYFGNEHTVGKTILMNEDKKPFTVTGVLKNIPSQSSIEFDFLLPMVEFPMVKRFSWSWVWQQMICFVKLRDHVNLNAAAIQSLEAKFPAMVRVQAASAFNRIGKPFDEFVKNGGRWDLHLLPLKDLHLYSAGIVIPWMNHISNIKYVYIFGSIALFIILLACVNFMNLSTAQSTKRSKEVGIRKVSGSTRGQLINQFMTEAFLFSFLSSLLAVVLVLVLLKPFSDMAGESIHIDSAFTPMVWIALLALTILIGLLAGSYPAFYLTSFNPITVLKGKGISRSGIGALLIRNSLVIFQFTISTILIIGTLVVFKQLNYFQNATMGLNKENVLVITNSNRLNTSEETFRQTLSNIPGVSNASITSSIPTGNLFGDSYVPDQQGEPSVAKDINLQSFIVDYDFVPTLKIEILKGRNFSKEFSDSGSVILNQESAKQIGWKDPIGQRIQYPGGNKEWYTVIGIAKDFNVQSLQTIISPFALFHVSSRSYDIGTSFMLVRLEPDHLNNTLKTIESTWKQFAPGEPFDYNFMDAAFDALYRSEQRMGKVFFIFTVLSLFIACFGLFGLSAYVAERRIKEIGVRKVLGASIQSIVTLISSDFLKLTFVAAFIAFPIAWWSMNKWLEDFAYRVDIGWNIFLFAGLGALLIALMTVSFQAIKAAVTNPVKSLRTD
ncbi:MAG: ABC transporter permease [Saprospiraceae bacterium]